MALTRCQGSEHSPAFLDVGLDLTWWVNGWLITDKGVASVSPTDGYSSLGPRQGNNATGTGRIYSRRKSCRCVLRVLQLLT